MAVSLGSNIAALVAQRRLNEAGNSLATTFERLSSGLRINRASDDAAGLAIASTLNAHSRIYGQGIRNINDGISALSIADGALGELSGLTTRLRELATQAANGSLSVTQRRALDAEADQLTHEFNRTIATVQFNGLGLLNRSIAGGLGVQGGIGSGALLNLNINYSLSRGVGNGTFAAASVLGGAAIQTAIETADFNRDGKLDLASIDATTLTINLGNGDGTFNTATFAAGIPIVGMTVADVDGNGSLDVIAGAAVGASIVVYTNDGTGTFTANSVNVGTASIIEAAADLNGDGMLDLVGRNGSSMYIYQGTGASTFSLSKTTTLNFAIIDIKAGDTNADGWTDIVAQTSSAVTNFSNGGNFLFSGSTLTLTGGGPYSGTSIDLGDANGDGHLDVLFTSSIGFGGFVPLFGNGDGSFLQGTSYGGSGSSRVSKFADVNGDGILDVLTTSNSAVTVRLGNGDGTFGASDSVTGAGSQNSMATGDFNGDGALDFVVNTNVTGPRLHLANAVYTTTMQTLNLNSQSSALESIAVIDATLTRILNERGDLGSGLRRLESALSNLLASRENIEAAAARIENVDVASEAANLARTQILQQSASAVLAQANQSPRLSLLLLRI